MTDGYDFPLKLYFCHLSKVSYQFATIKGITTWLADLCHGRGLNFDLYGESTADRVTSP